MRYAKLFVCIASLLQIAAGTMLFLRLLSVDNPGILMLFLAGTLALAGFASITGVRAVPPPGFARMTTIKLNVVLAGVVLLVGVVLIGLSNGGGAGALQNLILSVIVFVLLAPFVVNSICLLILERNSKSAVTEA